MTAAASEIVQSKARQSRDVPPSAFDCTRWPADHAHLIHQSLEVLLNLQRQVFDVLVKQSLLLSLCKCFVVCPALRVFAQLCSPVLDNSIGSVRLAVHS